MLTASCFYCGTVSCVVVSHMLLIKVRDTIEEVNVYGFLMNNIKFMPTIPLCCKTYQLLTVSKRTPCAAQNLVNIFKYIGGTFISNLSII